jgi:ABC-type sulfate transport system permease subunit
VGACAQQGAPDNVFTSTFAVTAMVFLMVYVTMPVYARHLIHWLHT